VAPPRNIGRHGEDRRDLADSEAHPMGPAPIPADIRLPSLDLLDLVPVPVIVMDREHSIVYLNPAGARTAGAASGQCSGVTLWNLFDSPECRNGTCATWRALSTGKVQSGKAVPVVREKQLDVLVTAIPLLNHLGKVIGAIDLLYPVEGIHGQGEAEARGASETMPEGNFHASLLRLSFAGSNGHDGASQPSPLTTVKPADDPPLQRDFRKAIFRAIQETAVVIYEIESASKALAAVDGETTLFEKNSRFAPGIGAVGATKRARLAAEELSHIAARLRAIAYQLNV